MNTQSTRQFSLFTESWLFASRLLIQWRRYPTVPLQALLFPTVLLVAYSLLVGTSMIRLTGNSGLDVLIPVCAVAGAMSGCVGAGMTMPHDRESGLLTRLWIMPVRRASALTGTLLAESMRTLVGTALILATGYALGFRFGGNIIELLVYLTVPSLVVVVYAMIVITLALHDQGRTILAWVGTASMGLAFAAIIPVAKLPALLRPVAQYQPVAPAIRAMSQLSQGAGAFWLPLAATVCWVVVLSALFGPLAARNYRQAAETGQLGD